MNSMLLRLVISQFKLFFREPGVVFWSFGFPVLMAWILGIAFASKGEILRNVALVSNNQASASTLPEWLLQKTGASSAEYSGNSELVWEVGTNYGDAIFSKASIQFLNECIKISISAERNHRDMIDVPDATTFSITFELVGF